MKKEKKIIIMNGRWYDNGHIYIGAYSIADACRICGELTGRPSNHYIREINEYFSKGCWGNSMDGVTPERGAWLSKDGREKPVRVL